MSKTVSQWIKDSKYKFCAVCGKTEDLQYHHWLPVELGGKDEPENIIVLCAKHHQEFHRQGGAIKHNRLVREGIRKAKERGVHVGKKPADYEKVMRLIAENSTQFNDTSLTTEHEIMKMAGVKDVCYSKCKRMLFEAMTADVWPYSWEKPVQIRNRPLYDSFIRKMRGDVV